MAQPFLRWFGWTMVSYDWAMVVKAKLTLVHPKRAQKPLRRKLVPIPITFSGVGNNGVALERYVR